MKVNTVMRCKCCDHEPDAGDSVYYGMPQLKVTNVDPATKKQFFEAYCPSCGIGGMFQYESAYLALRAWNELQKEVRVTVTDIFLDIDSPPESP